MKNETSNPPMKHLSLSRLFTLTLILSMVLPYAQVLSHSKEAESLEWSLSWLLNPYSTIVLSLSLLSVELKPLLNSVISKRLVNFIAFAIPSVYLIFQVMLMYSGTVALFWLSEEIPALIMISSVILSLNFLRITERRYSKLTSILLLALSSSFYSFISFTSMNMMMQDSAPFLGMLITFLFGPMSLLIGGTNARRLLKEKTIADQS